MFAVIKTGGKQYRVIAEDVLEIGRVEGEIGDIVEIGHVLAHGNGDDVTIGAPLVSGASVSAEILDQNRAAKVIAFKKRRRQNSRRKRGHRQLLTTVRIAEILLDGAKPSKKAAAKKDATTAETKQDAAPKAKKTAAAAAAADDLSLISGVGPALHAKLSDAGITTFKQIATLKKKDAEKLDEELSLGGRIERDEWIEQAKELMDGKAPRAKVDQKASKADGE